MTDITEAKRIALATIPPAALEAGAREVAEQLGDDWEDNIHTFCGDDFQMTPDGAKEACRTIARAACLATLKAWPGAIYNGHWLFFPHFKLPLPQEGGDE